MSDKSVYVKILVNYILTILIVLATIFLLPKAIAFMWPFVVGWIIAMIANPLVRILERKLKMLRKHGTVIVIIFVLAVVIGVMYALVYFLVKQGMSFVDNFPQMYETVSDNMTRMIENMRGKSSFIPGKISGMLDGFVDNIGALVNKFAMGMIENSHFSINDAGNVVKSVAEGLFMTIVTILLSYFLTSEHDKIVEVWKNNIPERIKKTYTTVSKCITSAFGGYFKAQFKIMCVIFCILLIGLLCLKVKYAILFAFIISFIDFLPIFGSGAIIWPWCIIEIASGKYSTALILFALYLLCQAVKQFMQPKMVGDSIGLSPLKTLFFMFVGYRIGGVLGMIIGIPVGMILVSFYKEGVFDNLIRGGKILLNAFDEWKKF